MLIALLSDVHSNLEALQACLKDAEHHGAERYAFLGDLIGYGADPGPVVDIIADYASRGAVVIKGNHDQAIDKQPRGLEDVAQEAIEWTRNALTPAQKSFLNALPMIVNDDGICYVHSSAAAPEQWTYILNAAAARESIEAAAGASYVFSGHVHAQVLYFKTMAGKTAAFHPISGSPVPIHSHHNWLAIVGSVGQPRDGNPAAAYALFDSKKEEVTFFRVPYNHLAAASKIRKAGLPEWLAQRIENAV